MPSATLVFPWPANLAHGALWPLQLFGDKQPAMEVTSGKGRYGVTTWWPHGDHVEPGLVQELLLLLAHLSLHPLHEARLKFHRRPFNRPAPNSGYTTHAALLPIAAYSIAAYCCLASFCSSLDLAMPNCSSSLLWAWMSCRKCMFYLKPRLQCWCGSGHYFCEQ